MNWLKGIVVIQTLILIALFYQVTQLGQSKTQNTQNNTEQLQLHSSNQQTDSAYNSIALESSDELKAIKVSLLNQQVQLEKLTNQLQALNENGLKQNILASLSEGKNITAGKASTFEQKEESQKLLYELDGFVQAGRISQKELDELQFKAAKLAPAQRKQFFREVAQSVNSGAMSIQ